MTKVNIEEFKKRYIPKAVGAGLNTMGVVAPGKAVSIALDIFRSPRKGRIQSNQKKFLKKFEYRELDFEGMKVATYDDNRPGKKVLLCHGWESNSSRWRKLYREFKKTNLNIIMIDAPAHGASGSDRFDGAIYAGFINAAVEYYQPSAIVGHSVGAYSVIYAIHKYQPSKVNQLVIMASPDKLVDISERYFNIIGLSSRLRIKYFEAMDDLFGFSANTFNAADFAKSIQVPALIIHDKNDDINLFHEGESINNAWSDSQLIATSGLGHSLQDKSVYSTIIDYLT